MKRAELDTLLTELYETSVESRKMEKRLKELKEIVKNDIGSGAYGDYIVTIEDRERESFSLKDARASVTKAVWDKIKVFVKVTEFKLVRVVRA